MRLVKELYGIINIDGLGHWIIATVQRDAVFLVAKEDHFLGLCGKLSDLGLDERLAFASEDVEVLH